MFEVAKNLANVSDSEIANAIHFMDAMSDDMETDDYRIFSQIKELILEHINQGREGAAIDAEMNSEATYLDLVDAK